MKAILVLAMMLQHQAEAGQMCLNKKYTAAECASASLVAEEYIEAGLCANYGDSDGAFYAIATCNAEGHTTATKYSDSMCQNVDTSFNGYGYTSGVHNHAGACVAQAASGSSTATHHETVACVTVDTVSFPRYTDAACTVAHTGADATGLGAINVCEYGPAEGGGVMSAKNVLLPNGSVQTSSYTNNACTGTGTTVQMLDPNACMYDGGMQKYFKWDGAVSSATDGSSSSTGGSSSSTNSSSNSSGTVTVATASKSTLQRGFLALPLFMGVVAFLL